jgi:hypothetical protein
MVSLQELAPLVIIFVVATIVIGIGADIVSSVKFGECQYGDNGLQCLNSTGGTGAGGASSLNYAYNISNQGILGLDEVGSWLDTIGLVLGAAAVIGIVYAFFMRQ